MKITPEVTILNLVFQKLLIPDARPQCSNVIDVLKFTKLPCPFVFLAKALELKYHFMSLELTLWLSYISYVNESF